MTEKLAPNNMPDAPVFKIGAASRITGIPVDTLRIWERRYSVVSPRRSKGADRLYSSQDIKRLILIKQLTDEGHAIGSIANLSNDKLQEQLDLVKSSPALQVPEQVKLLKAAIMGDTLVHLIKKEYEDKDIEFVCMEQYVSELEKFLKSQAVDILVLEYPSIQNNTTTEIRKLARLAKAKHTFIVYGFSSSSLISAFNPDTFTFTQAPVPLESLLATIRKTMGIEKLESKDYLRRYLDMPVPERMFTNKGLAHASLISTTIKCECPKHLSNLIQQLLQFEIYSAECKVRNKEDAALHAGLKSMAGHARALMEMGLKNVLDEEGISIEEYSNKNGYK